MLKSSAGNLERVTLKQRSEGNAALLALILLSVFAGFSVTQYAVTQKNLRQSDYFTTRNELRRYAEAGIASGYHDLKYNVSGQDCNLRTVEWDSEIGDFGADGYAGTLDEGEGDGIPTVGEPGVVATSIRGDGASFIVYVDDAAYAGGKRIVASATNGTDTVIVETIRAGEHDSDPARGCDLREPERRPRSQRASVPHRRPRHQPRGYPGPW